MLIALRSGITTYVWTTLVKVVYIGVATDKLGRIYIGYASEYFRCFCFLSLTNDVSFKIGIQTF